LTEKFGFFVDYSVGGLLFGSTKYSLRHRRCYEHVYVHKLQRRQTERQTEKTVYIYKLQANYNAQITIRTEAKPPKKTKTKKE